MGACLRILVPDATTNYVLNPALRYDTTGWSSAGSAISRSSDYARFNIASLKVVTSGLVNREGAYYRVSALSGISEPITVSAYARGNGRVHIRLIDNPAGKEWVGPTTILTPDRWVRMEVSGFSTGRDDMRLYVETDDQVQSITFYVDGAQMERHPYSTTYCDGDQPGCRWNLESHGSRSVRLDDTRLGGRWVDLGGPCRENDDIYFTVVGGFGMAPIQNNTNLWPSAPGGYYGNTKVTDRIVTLSFFTKNKMLSLKGPPSLDKLHRLRQQLIDVFKSDLTSPEEPFLLEYTQGDRPLYLRAYYEGGLEGEWDIRNPWINSFPVRMLSTEPFFFEDNQEIQELDFQNSGTFNGIARKKDGVWDNMNYGLVDLAGVTQDGIVYALALGRKGEIYAGGTFDLANYSSDAVDPLRTARGIAYWDGTQWRVLKGDGIPLGGTVYSIAIAPNGDVYISGIFSSVSGVSAAGIAKYSWATDSWSALGSGLGPGSQYAYAMVFAPNGDLYVGGTFTTAGGNPCRYMARWDGGTWHPVGPYGGLNQFVLSMAITEDGSTIYIGGIFTDQYSLSANGLKYVAKYDIDTDTFSSMAPNNWTLGYVDSIAISPNSGRLVVGRRSTDVSGGLNLCYASEWDGNSFRDFPAIGYSGTPAVRGLAFGKNDELIAVGAFTTIDGKYVPSVAVWNGTTWLYLDIFLRGYSVLKPTIISALVTPDLSVILGGGNFSLNAAATSIYSGVTLVNNTGSAEVRPILRVVGPAKLRSIENITTGKRVNFDLELDTGEELYVNFDTGESISLGGNIVHGTSLSGSDLHSFSLVPGENKISAFMTHDGPGALMQLYYTPIHWSSDAVEVVEAL